MLAPRKIKVPSRNAGKGGGHVVGAAAAAVFLFDDRISRDSTLVSTVQNDRGGNGYL